MIGALCALFQMWRFFLFDGCTAEKLMHFCPPVYERKGVSEQLNEKFPHYGGTALKFCMFHRV